jgi:hypothetical protein
MASPTASSARSSAPADVAPYSTRSSHAGVIGAAWLVGAAFWFAAGFVHADDGWRYDIAAVLWTTADLLILVGLAGLFRLRPHGARTVGTVALLGAIAGRLAFAGGEVTSIVQGHDDNALLPVGVMLTVASLVVYGLVVVRQRRWTGPGRFAVLVMAVYPLVAMMPIAAATGEPPAQLIAVWGVPTALVGLACLIQRSPVRPRTHDHEGSDAADITDVRQA